MKLNIKAIIGCLVVLVLVSLFSLSSSFRNLLKSDVAFNWPSFGPVETDNDSDGLDNKNEIYWGTDPENPDTDGDGFLDGEEVISGRNPLVPGPDDSFEDINLTDRFSEMAAIGMVEGSLKEDSPIRDEIITGINLSIIDDAVASFENRFFRISTIRVENNKENIDSYFKNLNSILIDFISVYVDETTFISEEISSKGFLNFEEKLITQKFSDYRKKTGNLVDRASKLRVPEVAYEIHQSLLRMMVNVDGINNALEMGLEDPLRAEIGLSRLVRFYDILGDTVIAMSLLAEKNNYEVEGTVFER